MPPCKWAEAARCRSNLCRRPSNAQTRETTSAAAFRSSEKRGTPNGHASICSWVQPKIRFAISSSKSAFVIFPFSGDACLTRTTAPKRRAGFTGSSRPWPFTLSQRCGRTCVSQPGSARALRRSGSAWRGARLDAIDGPSGMFQQRTFGTLPHAAGRPARVTIK